MSSSVAPHWNVMESALMKTCLRSGASAPCSLASRPLATMIPTTATTDAIFLVIGKRPDHVTAEMPRKVHRKCDSFGRLQVHRTYAQRTTEDLWNWLRWDSNQEIPRQARHDGRRRDVNSLWPLTWNPKVRGVLVSRE